MGKPNFNVGEMLSANVLGETFNGLDGLITSAEERGTIKARVIGNAMDLEKSKYEAQTAIVVAEANSKSWISRNWRPIGMLTFITIVAYNYIVVHFLKIFLPESVPDQLPIPPGMWALLTTGFGGYVVGRSGEEIAKTISGANMFSSDKVAKEKNKALLKALKTAQKKGDSETAQKILEMMKEDSISSELLNLKKE